MFPRSATSGGPFAAEPDDALLDIVADAHTREECALLDGEDGEGARLQDALAEVAAANGLGQLRSVYTKLFIGPAKLPAPPWESVYATGEPLLFQESTLAVREAYRRAGYAAAGYPHEADDHLAVELDFMATLASDARAAYEAGDKGRSADLLSVQRDFLREHLLAWVGGSSRRGWRTVPVPGPSTRGSQSSAALGVRPRRRGAGGRAAGRGVG